ncbi:MAG: thiamine pyrophosphate-binding protein, partial [Rhodobacteraceae bacterium]|nr:thiamine pyrophosphate-binding protein [Paracoccaceae bacterium]
MTDRNSGAGNELIGAEVMARVLRRFGVKSVFALAGASQTHLLDRCDKLGMNIVPGRHESATVGAADGYSRVTGKVGIAMVNVDQGMPNAITGLQQAYEACSPVVVLIGREEDSWTEPELGHDHDVLGLVQHCTKWARTVHSPSRLGEYLEAACRRALQGHPGPVALAFAKNYLPAKVLPGVDLDSLYAGVPSPAPSADDISRAVDLISAAKRPMVIAGSGAFKSGAGAALNALAHQFGIPVLTNNLARGMVPEDWRVGFGWPLAQTAAKDADLVIWAGGRMMKKFGYGLAPRFPASTKTIQIDISGNEIGRSRPVDVGMAVDCKLALDAIVARLTEDEVKPFDPSWIGQSMKPRLDAIAAAGHETEGIHPYRLAREVEKRLPKDAIFVQDGASILVRCWASMKINAPGGYIDTMPLGSMGMGMGLALGAVRGAQDLAAQHGGTPRRVVMITGDGAFGFYPS